MTTPPIRHLNAREVAELFGVSHRTLMRMVKAGDLPAEKLPGRTGSYIFTEDDVAAALAKRGQTKQEAEAS